MARAFITGGGGFLANHLAVSLLEAGNEVTVLARRTRPPRVPKGARVAKGDLLKGDKPLIPAGTEVVYHLAARSSVPESTADPHPTYEVNVMGTARLLEEVRERGLNLDRFVLASTGQVYGPPFEGRIGEDHALLPRNVYSASKAAADHYAVACADLYQIPVCVVRLFNVYGPGQRPQLVIPSVLAQCLWSKEVRIGNPWPVRDFLHVEDAVALFERAAARGGAGPEVINAGSGVGVSIRDMVDTAMEATGRTLEVRAGGGRGRPNDFDRLVADVSKAKRLLGWEPRVSLRDGLERTARWMIEDGQHRGRGATRPPT